LGLSVYYLRALFLSRLEKFGQEPFYLRDFVGKADDRTDDGPAILRMVEAARAMKGKPVRLVFPSL